MTYPNACHAECDGFIEADVANDCGGDYNWTGGEECFTYNFPLTIITDEGNTITVSSQDELINVSYNSYYYEFVYSFDVTLVYGNVLSIGNEEAFLELLESCFEDGYNNPQGCSEEDISNILVQCIWEIEADEASPNYEGGRIAFNTDGTLTYNALDNTTYTGTWFTWIEVNDLEGDLFIHFNIPDYNNTIAFYDWQIIFCSENLIELNSNDGSILALTKDCADDNFSDCSEEGIINMLAECQWISISNTFPDLQGKIFEFDTDGSVTTTDLGTSETFIGTFDTSSNLSGKVYIYISTYRILFKT